MGGQTQPAWVQDVLRFWFEELEPAAWFRKSDATDAVIRERFADLLDALISQLVVDEAMVSPDRALATVIVLDQFSRNIHRGTARAFEADPMALAVARRAVERGFDRSVESKQRLFFYLPFEHSENGEDQARCVALTEGLGNPELTRYAVAHKQIIDRFGRFPHRNGLLGRTSTPEEEEFLKQPGSSF